jgi:hypothetical protein
VPSGSVEPDPSSVATRSAAVEVNRAVGAAFGTGAGPTGTTVSLVKRTATGLVELPVR